eukprot:TRINITY_DN10412_c0_g1_i5.p1 TRINITY_DN10412_c0_g1~~TRINITY_DN10412_c0_g1_i5.p1  ORF type:complete len:678 (+),score=140.41 TRINITY_DN10412_c0_g1_i5:23-2035(+)
MAVMLFFALGLISQGRASTWNASVCCSCSSGNDDNSFTSIGQAQNALRAVDRSQFSGAIITIKGHCVQTSPVALTSEDSGSEQFAIVYQGVDGARIIGGPAVTRSQVEISQNGTYKIDFASLNITDLGTFHRHTYLGGSGCVNLYLENITGLELVYWPEGEGVAGAASWLHFAQYPDASVNCNGWSEITAKTATPNVLEVDSSTAARFAQWRRELAYNSDAQIHGFWNGIGWADATRRLLEVYPNGTMVTEASISGDVDPAAGGYFYTYNLRSEMDVPGEMYINRTGKFLEFIPPSSPAMPENESAVVGYLSIAESLVTMTNVSYVTFADLELAASRGAGVIITGGANNTVNGLTIHHVGTMGVNVTDSPATRVEGNTIYATGSGGINLHGGDRETLRPSQMVAAGNDVYEYTRVTSCYVAGIHLGGVGNQAVGNRVHHADHMALFAQGNDHLFDSNVIHDVVRSTRDSGAYYMGRDWTYRGIRIINNTFYNINSWFHRSTASPNSVHSVYLDDSASGCYIANNSFHNVTTAFLLGGGRDNVFEHNTIDGCGQGGVHTSQLGGSLGTPVLFDNRDMNWAKSGCADPNGILQTFLKRVPYNKPPYTKYPHLANILDDDPCRPKYNQISFNAYCNLLNNNWFIDDTNTTIASWNSSNVGNHPLNASCSWVPA